MKQYYMGSDQSIYYGAYIKCRIPKVDVSILVSKRCPKYHTYLAKDLHGDQKTMQFCPKCGSPLHDDLKIEQKANRDIHWKVIDEISEQLMVPCFQNDRTLDDVFDVFIPNISSNAGFFGDTQGICGIKNTKSPQEYRDALQAEFAQALAVIRQHYTDVEIGVGLLIWWD